MNMSVTSKMTTNCGMQSMHQNNFTTTSQVTNTGNSTPNLGSKFDAKV